MKDTCVISIIKYIKILKLKYFSNQQFTGNAKKNKASFMLKKYYSNTGLIDKMLY